VNGAFKSSSLITFKLRNHLKINRDTLCVNIKIFYLNGIQKICVDFFSHKNISSLKSIKMFALYNKYTKCTFRQCLDKYFSENDLWTREYFSTKSETLSSGSVNAYFKQTKMI